MDHRLSLSYSVEDDGVWLHCTCGEFDVCAGHLPDLDAVNERANAHLLEVAD